MLAIHRVLYPTDFSDCAAHALPFAIRFAEVHGASLHMLHVLVLHGMEVSGPDDLFPGEEEARAALRAAGEGQNGDRVEHVVKRGFAAAPVILEHAADGEMDLIVMSSHGRRGVRRLLLGSIAEEVVRLAPCPVLTIRHCRESGPEEPVEFRRIVVPVDFSSHTELAVEYARELAGVFGGEVHLLHVIELPTYPDFYVPVSSSGLNVAELRDQSSRRLDRLAAESFGADSNVTSRVHVTVGRTTGEIVDFATDISADLIIIPSHGLSGLERALLGSVAEGVMRRAPCSVLTAKPFGKRLVEPAEQT